jgi:hypothetical protein
MTASASIGRLVDDRSIQEGDLVVLGFAWLRVVGDEALPWSAVECHALVAEGQGAEVGMVERLRRRLCAGPSPAQ